MVGSFKCDFLIGLKVFVDILEGRGWRDWFENTEAQSMCLVRLMVWILPNNNYLNAGDGRHFKGIEDIFFFGVDLSHNENTFLPDSYSSLTNL